MEQSAGVTGSRRLLRRLRDVMAGADMAQIRLDKVAKLIAADMVAEVCSVYLRRAGDILELFATEGLNPEAVHRTRLRVGEGIVGVVAANGRPLALADAQSHPSFAYRPETGEEIYHSMMGVPILRGGRTLGVLVVQNRVPRHYLEEEIETLETTAMVLAELVAGGELVNPYEQENGEQALLPRRLEGVRLNGGLAMGTAVLHRLRPAMRRVVAEDPEAELARLSDGVTAMQLAIDVMLAASDMARGGEHRDILETYRMFASDRGWLSRIREAVSGGLTAEAAVERVQVDTRRRMGQATDPYLRERLGDLEDLAERLLQHLSGEMIQPGADLPENMILVARSLGPAQLLDYDRRRLRGVVLEEGSTLSHVAVVAKALDIPVVGRARDALSHIEPGDLVVVDGDDSQVFVRPSVEVQAQVETSILARTRRQAAYAELRDLPAVTRDGVAITLQMNAGLLIDLPHLDATGAAGIGLFRTELPFMVRSTFPDVAQQAEIYGRVLDHAGDRPVNFRTLDIGGDKILPYMPEVPDENPAMGWRAIRIALDRPVMLREQVRGLIRAAAGRRLRIKFPMVAEIAEFEAARRIVEIELRRADRLHQPLPAETKIGVMLEVPALLWQLPALFRKVDFISVGSNDLTQFLFASDRGNARLADRYDALSPAVLACLHDLARQADAAGVPLSLCGEMAGRPIEALALIGIGFRSLSMAPSAIGQVKALIRSVELQPLRQYMARLIDMPDHSVRQKLRFYARDRGIAL